MTVVELLRRRAAEEPDRTAYVFLRDGLDEDDSLTYGQLDLRARAVAAALQEITEPGDRALLLYAPGLEFVAGFCGCLYAGVVAVPLYAPTNNRGLGRILSVLEDSRPEVALTTSDVLDKAREQLPADTRWLATDTVPSDAAAWREQTIAPEALA